MSMPATTSTTYLFDAATTSSFTNFTATTIALAATATDGASKSGTNSTAPNVNRSRSATILTGNFCPYHCY